MNALISPPRGSARPSAKVERTQQAYSWPAPTGGMVANGNIAVSQPGTAYWLENWFCTATSIILRRGKVKKADVGGNGDPVRSLFTYQAGIVRRLFAANDTGTYDITASGTPSVAFACTDGNWVTVQMQASDGSMYLRGVNGTDTPFVFDGTDFDTTPALTFPGGESVTPEQLNYVWTYKQRLFFIQKETLDAWYLPAGQIGGELTKFSLGGLMRLGGHLVMGATWSRDTGSGLAAVCAFFSSEGEVAIYQGENPAEVQSWSLVGVYRIGKPLGPHSMIEAGGDLVIATDIGFIPLSRALDTDYAILGTQAVSENIVDLWNEEADLRSAGNWNAALWSSKQMVVVALPTVNDQPPRWLVTNAKTRGWSIYSGWSATCLAVLGNELFFGSEDGFVYTAEVSGMDDGNAYTGICLMSFDQMGTPGYKTASMMRAVFRGPYEVREKIVDRVDFDTSFPSPPSASQVTSDDAVWGDAEWGDAEWASSGTDRSTFQRWRAVHGGGEVHAPLVMVTSGSNVPADVELVRVDATFTSGEMVT